MKKKEEEGRRRKKKKAGERKRKRGDMPQNTEVQNLGGGMRAHVQWPLVPDATRNLGAEAPRVPVVASFSAHVRLPKLLGDTLFARSNSARTTQENKHYKTGQGPLSAYPCRK